MKDFINGLIAGSCGVVVSHPFDTLKTNIQSNIKINYKQLYKGFLPPLIGVGIEKSIVFGSYNYFRKYNNSFMSGMGAGILCSTIVTPFEYLKINLQNRLKINLLNMYNGFGPTLLREGLGFSIYFSCFEYLNRNNISKNNLQIAINGGLSGCISWAVIYPIDIIKTNIQCSNSIKNINGYYKGFSLSMLRCIPLHATVFLVYENLK